MIPQDSGIARSVRTARRRAPGMGRVTMPQDSGRSCARGTRPAVDIGITRCGSNNRRARDLFSCCTLQRLRVDGAVSWADGMERFMNRQLTAIIEREGDGYVSLCPELDVASPRGIAF